VFFWRSVWQDSVVFGVGRLLNWQKALTSNYNWIYRKYQCNDMKMTSFMIITVNLNLKILLFFEFLKNNCQLTYKWFHNLKNPLNSTLLVMKPNLKLLSLVWLVITQIVYLSCTSKNGEKMSITEVIARKSFWKYNWQFL
jgi:hypothetical protein